MKKPAAFKRPAAGSGTPAAKSQVEEKAEKEPEEPEQTQT